MNEVIRALKERRSIRSYRTEQVREEDLQQILEAATYAPSGMGAQPVILVAVQDPATIARLSQLNAAVMGTKTDPFYGAPTVVVVLADQSRATWLEDGSLAMGNLMLAAHALGLGSCWVHRAREVFAGAEGQAGTAAPVGHPGQVCRRGPLPFGVSRRASARTQAPKGT